jgi:hypothetical protein
LELAQVQVRGTGLDQWLALGLVLELEPRWMGTGLGLQLVLALVEVLVEKLAPQ